MKLYRINEKFSDENFVMFAETVRLQQQKWLFHACRPIITADNLSSYKCASV